MNNFPRETFISAKSKNYRTM
ncbi:protein of unknown function [Thermococcus nautili]|nr:protein of unknown function [Thermococcus nautili]